MQYEDLRTEYSNVSPMIESKMKQDLLGIANHPLNTIARMVESYFADLEQGFKFFRIENPVVTVEDNFDRLLIKKDHPSRLKRDTYYVDENHVLRTHTSAHQNQILSRGVESFLVTGKVFRKDTVDRTHYPVFHQIEGVFCVEGDAVEQLKKTLSGLVQRLFPGAEYRFNDDYFPFTHPSFEIEVLHNDEWLEILGCGVVEKQILKNNRIDEKRPFVAFGLGLERLAMILFDIPDIRLFWSHDESFIDQFRVGAVTKFKPYSPLEPQSRDVSFWIPPDQLDKDNWSRINDFYEYVRELSGDQLESVELKDVFFHKKKQQMSHMFRLTFRPTSSEMKDPGELTKHVNRFMDGIRSDIGAKFDVDLR